MYTYHSTVAVSWSPFGKHAWNQDFLGHRDLFGLIVLACIVGIKVSN